MRYHHENVEDIITSLSSDDKVGLTEEQVSANREKYGSNEYEEEKKETLFQKILHHLVDVMNLILLFAAGLSFYISLREPGHGFTEPIVILFILAANIFVAVLQEGKAADALASLKGLSSPVSRVIRNGETVEIPSTDVVMGDLLLVEAGNQIGADIRLLRANQLQIDESSLTGESESIDKDPSAQVDEDVALGDQINMVFAGTSVVNGNAVGIVVGVGMNSQMGHVAGLLSEQTKEKTPLQKRIDKLAKQLAVLAFIAGFLIFIINSINSDIPFFENLMTAVTLAIAAVPETLPVIVTLSLAYGVENMANRHAIIRNIPAVETLGSASIIASDKTGTLTQNQMTIQRVWALGSSAKDVSETWTEDEEKLLTFFGLASNAEAQLNSAGEIVVYGDSTESSIVRLLIERDMSKTELDKKFERVYEIPFDSTRKKMTTVHKDGDRYLVITKGAFDRLTHGVANEQELEANDYHTVHDGFANDALRVLALTYKYIDTFTEDESVLETDHAFFGIVGIIDPPRPESKKAVADARNAGIKPIMITGDHALTATAIARELDIYREGDTAVTGVELAKMSDDDLAGNIESYSVYARVSPEDKIRIVQAWQSKGHVVAMTGDGVNDAPSLKAADVGTAMGKAGTEVAKNASDMILTDDNFATIVAAVSEGRRVYSNIKKTVYYLLSANVAEIIVMLVAALIGWGTPISGIQLLFINVIADGIPGFGLSREKADEGIMEEKPIGINESLFSKGGYRRIATAALSFTLVTLFAYYLGAFVNINGMAPSADIGQTMAFLVLGLSSTVHIFVARSNEPIFNSKISSNPMIYWTGSIAVLITLLVVAIEPIGSILGVSPIGPMHWLVSIVLSIIIIVVIEAEKMILRKMGKKFIA